MEPLRYEVGTVDDISLRNEFSIIIIQQKFSRIRFRKNERSRIEYDEDDSDRCPDGRMEILKK
uniref:Bm13115, isoform a n=1 Tax=Brugia malayi TaxID=6279 RepID=A0A1I9G2Q5_BRUMA|nr:Bm13115, isoform a [Brugia malayi]